jgi:hypothetical protein
MRGIGGPVEQYGGKRGETAVGISNTSEGAILLYNHNSDITFKKYLPDSATELILKFQSLQAD